MTVYYPIDINEEQFQYLERSSHHRSLTATAYGDREASQANRKRHALFQYYFHRQCYVIRIVHTFFVSLIVYDMFEVINSTNFSDSTMADLCVNEAESLKSVKCLV